MKTAQQFLDFLDSTYRKLHTGYEKYFWISYMGDKSVDAKMNSAQAKRDAFRANSEYLSKVHFYLADTKTPAKLKTRLGYWKKFFESYQTPPEALEIKNLIAQKESEINKRRGTRKERYRDPKTGKFIEASENKMRSLMLTETDEPVRKAIFEALETLSEDCIESYIEVVNLRNQYARTLGYADFYEYKVQREDGVSKKELFDIFDTIYEKTKYAKKDIIALEKKMPGLRKPWNFGFMLAGDFVKEEDPYFQFDDALLRWGRSFAALGIDMNHGTLQLDLLDRKGKWNNGFCHWPILTDFKNGTSTPGTSNFTCNVVAGQIGSGENGYNTLFHEGGHAAHFLNVRQEDSCISHEYAPMTASWAETHSMFCDEIFSSIEWLTRYAKNKEGESYPFDLYVRRKEKTHILAPLALNSVIFVSNYEREIYEQDANKLTPEKVKEIARRNFRKYFERSEDSLLALRVPHIYSWESSGSYHGYGLATLAVEQWRAYFFKKYGYIVDNPKVGAEMKKVWQMGASHTFNEFVKIATGKKLSANAFLKDATASLDTVLKEAKKRIKRLASVKEHTKPVDLKAKIKMVHGKKTIADNRISFEKMAEKYGAWVRKMANL